MRNVIRSRCDKVLQRRRGANMSAIVLLLQTGTVTIDQWRGRLECSIRECHQKRCKESYIGTAIAEASAFKVKRFTFKIHHLTK